MGGFFGVASKKDAISDVFFGTDYHSHLGTKRGGMAAFDDEIGLQRDIHNIENTPFRTKFDKIFDEMKGRSGTYFCKCLFLLTLFIKFALQ
jgi:amidophosphoribosyltransferase